jgi:shikimate 5-dehydrogenase
MIEKTTTLFALIGDNLAHDKRPQIINYLFGQGNDDAALIPMNIRPDDLPFTLKGLKQSQIKGAIID